MAETFSELIARNAFATPIGTQIGESVLFYNFTGCIGNDSRIDDYSILTGNVIIRDRVHISPFTFLSGTGGIIEFMNGSGLGSHSAVLTKSDDYSPPRTIGKAKIMGGISVGKNSIVGSNCVILPNTQIGMNCIIGAGVTIDGYVEDNSKIVSAGSRYIVVSK